MIEGRRPPGSTIQFPGSQAVQNNAGRTHYHNSSNNNNDKTNSSSNNTKNGSINKEGD